MPTDTILHKAAHSGDLNQVKKIVELGKIDGKKKTLKGVSKPQQPFYVMMFSILVNAAGAADRRPLHRAAASDNVAMCTYLVANGAIVDQQDKTGRTPLHWASISGAAKSTSYLLNDVKADLFALTSDNVSPLHLASECGHINLVNVIIKSAGTRKIELFNLKTSEGKTACELAKVEQKKNVVKALKAAGDKSVAGSSVCTIS